MKKRDISRRKFLGEASCAALGSTTFFSSLLDLKKINAAAAASSSILDGSYKAMVCILLQGGNDSFNMLIPTGTSEYNAYATTRSNLAIPQADILNLNGINYGFHPAMTGAQNLFNSGRLSLISNIGTLIEPITKTQFYNESIPVPLGLYSHADQMQQWQTSVPHDRTSIGWGGKMADLLSSMNGNSNVSMNIALGQQNTFQKGETTVEYVIDPEDGPSGIRGYGDADARQQIQTNTIDHYINQAYADAFKQSYVDVIKISRDAHQELSSALAGVPDFTMVSFTDNHVSQSLNMIAKTIAARSTLSAQRQIFFIEFGGWDHHDEVLTNQNEMLGVLSDAMSEFNTALNEINVADCVTTFTMSEFSRTLTSNGNGTDHAWGGNMMVMGGDINGGQLFGSYPSLVLDNSIEVGGGVLIPQLSCDEYFAELAMWFGVNNGDLADIFPNLGNFYSTGSGAPIGFLNV